jgi:outer membrane protein, heavy metal efflux system
MFLYSMARPRRAEPTFQFAVAAIFLTFNASLWAQASSASASATEPLTISEAYRLALAQQPWQAAQNERQREQEARARVADSWLADQPTIESGYRAGNREGLREYEIGLSASISTPYRRSLQVGTARSEVAVYEATLAQQRIKLAGEIRETYWSVLLASAELLVAKDEASRAEQLAADSARRTAAGDSARVDTLQAQTLLQTARSNLVEVEAKLEVARQALRALTGDSAMRALADRGEAAIERERYRALLLEHPSVLVVGRSVAAARAKLNEASNVVNAAPSLSFTLANERTSGSANAASARVGISIPFGGAQRASPRIAQANAELIEAQASEPLVRQQLRAEAESAARTLAATEKRIETLAERARLATEVAELYAKAYRLGELDLPTRLRAEGERASATLALARARIEQKHAISRVNQSLGMLP